MARRTSGSCPAKDFVRSGRGIEFIAPALIFFSLLPLCAVIQAEFRGVRGATQENYLEDSEGTEDPEKTEKTEGTEGTEDPEGQGSHRATLRQAQGREPSRTAEAQRRSQK